MLIQKQLKKLFKEVENMEDRTISISVSSGDNSTFWNKEERIVWF